MKKMEWPELEGPCTFEQAQVERVCASLFPHMTMGSDHAGLTPRQRRERFRYLVANALYVPPPVTDSDRIEWIEKSIKHYGDGYNEPFEAAWHLDWQQRGPGEKWPGFREWIDSQAAESKVSEFPSDSVASSFGSAPDLRQHSVLLNRVLWRMQERMGEIPEGATQVIGNPEAIIERFFASSHLPESLTKLPERWRSGGYSADTRPHEAAGECADELEAVIRDLTTA